MTISFFSNFLNHHQLPLCLAFIDQIGEGNFHFIATTPIESERLKMGYEDMNTKYNFVVRSYESEQAYQYALQLAKSSDVVILGSAPVIFTEVRMRENKLTFKYIERLFKNGTWHRFLPQVAYRLYAEYVRYKNKNMYILCASSFAQNDLSLIGFHKEKCFKWGYFPKTILYKEQDFSTFKSKRMHLLWVGRMLWWKHPLHAVFAAKFLKDRNIDFHLTMIGEGEELTKVNKMIKNERLENYVTVLPFMSPQKIRSYMENANVYLFTSGREEGWGAVLTEAMNSGCMIVANLNAGATSYLVENNNGLIYDGTLSGLNKVLSKFILLDETSILHYGINSYKQIVNCWNANKAILNFIQLVRNLNNNDSGLIIENGPCSEC